MEIKINKEIRSYKETVYFGLTARQLICSLLAVGTAVGLYFALRGVLDRETLGWLCIVGAAPMAAAGFFHYNGLTLEQFLWAWCKTNFLQEIPTELLPVELAVHQRQLDARVDGQAVEDAAVAQKQLHLLFRRGHGVIDIKKTPGLGKPAAYLKNAVLIDALDGDGLLHTAENAKGVPFRAAALE